MAKAAKKTRTRKAAPVQEDVEETTTEEAPAKAKRQRKARPERTGMSSREAAEYLSEKVGRVISPVALRRVLRTDDFTNDNSYTRYDLDQETLDRLEQALSAGADSQKGRTRKPRKGSKKAAQVEEEASEEVQEELEDLEADDEDAEEELELDEDEDEDFEDDEDED